MKSIYPPILLFLQLFSVFTQYIPSLPDPRDDLKHPSSLQSIERIYFPGHTLPQNTSEIEDDPSSYSLLSPLNGSQEGLLFPQTIKQNSPEAYNLNGVNMSAPMTEFQTDPKTRGIVLVHNISALRFLPGYNGLLNEEEEVTGAQKLPPKYKKDPLPYYSPIHNGSEIITEKEKENMFAVPIEFSDERNPYDPDNENLHEIRKARLTRSTPSTYYDPTYWPYYRRPDGINKTLLEAAFRKTKPKAIRLDDFIRQERSEEREKRMILGQWNFSDELKVDKTKNWELMKENSDDLFNAWYNNTMGLVPSYPIKKSDPKSYTLKFKEKKSQFKKGLLKSEGKLHKTPKKHHLSHREHK